MCKKNNENENNNEHFSGSACSNVPEQYANGDEQYYMVCNRSYCCNTLANLFGFSPR
jgi:hypothetical protein